MWPVGRALGVPGYIADILVASAVLSVLIGLMLARYRIRHCQNLDVPLLSELPFFGVALFWHTSLTYAALLNVPVVMYVLYPLLDAFQVRMQQQAGAYIPYQFFLMLPYILSIVTMIIVARRAEYPRAMLKPYRRGERL